MKRRDLFGVLVLFVVVALGALLAVRYRDRIGQRELGDFAEYWAAGRLAVVGENPYDKDRMKELQNEAGRPGEPVLMYNPPWALTFVLPLGHLDARAAHALWQFAHVLVLMLTAELLGRVYGGRGVGWLATFTFLPCYVAVAMGQIAPLMPLGVALFLLAVRADRDFLAGLACTLLSIKPQAGLLFWAALGLWVLTTGRWRVLAGLAAGISSCLVVPLWLNPQVIGQYLQMVQMHPPTQYKSPTWGAVLRLLLGVEYRPEYFWLQYVAPVVGLAWVAWYWCRHRADWDWGSRAPLVLLVSLTTMAYGWFYDLVLALPAVVLGFCLPVRAFRDEPARVGIALVGYVAASAAILAQLAAGVDGFDYLWAAPAFLALYLLGVGHERAALDARQARPARG